MSRVKLDLNGDGDFVDANEHDDTRTYNKANELQDRDTNSSAPVEYTLTHDAVGNMTDDGESYTYKYDPFGRLVEVRQRSGSQYPVAKYRYDGLGQRIQDLRDTNGDGRADDTAGDLWFDNVYDGASRRIATYRRTGSSTRDTFPKERLVYNSSDSGYTGLFVGRDEVLFRDRDANTAWTALADGTLEERYYYCHDWRGDLVAIIDDQGRMVEWVKYSSYGVPFGLCGGDADSDGDCDGGDLSQISSWISSGYDRRGDLDLDNDVDTADYTRAQSVFLGTTLGRGSLSSVSSRVGWRAQECDSDIGQKYHFGSAIFACDLGDWLNDRALAQQEGPVGPRRPHPGALDEFGEPPELEGPPAPEPAPDPPKEDDPEPVSEPEDRDGPAPGTGGEDDFEWLDDMVPPGVDAFRECLGFCKHKYRLDAMHQVGGPGLPGADPGLRIVDFDIWVFLSWQWSDDDCPTYCPCVPAKEDFLLEIHRFVRTKAQAAAIIQQYQNGKTVHGLCTLPVIFN